MANASDTTQKNFNSENRRTTKMQDTKTETTDQTNDQNMNRGKHLGQYKRDNRSIQLHPENNPDMCLSYSADGLGVTTCENTPDHYWLMAGTQAVERANADSGMAGSDATKLEETEQGVETTTSSSNKKSESKTGTKDTASTKNTSTKDTSSKDTSSKDTSTKDTTNETSTDDTSTNDTSTNDTSTNDTTTKDTTNESVSKFQGHIGLDGFRFKLTFMDLIFLLLLLYVFYYLL
jgi:cobalamin biosynthesis Mg chelatase CobN